MREGTIILQSGRCAWARCFACGWGRLGGPRLSLHELKQAFDKRIRKLKVKRLKIFCSGSFLDDAQFPAKFRAYVARKAAQAGIKELVIESRPEFITAQKLREMRKFIKLTVAIGLEIADNKILKRYNKGFTVEDFVRAAKLLKSCDCGVRVYLMVGLPFVKSQRAALRKSVAFVRKYADEIVLINTFPHAEAPLFDMWLAGRWRPLDKKQFETLTAEFKDCEKDFENFLFIPRFPKRLRKPIVGASVKNLLQPAYEVWQDYICRFWEPEKKKKILFIPCAYRKPYYKSKLHKAILSVVPKDVQLVVISSPGVIPYEFANYYPFNAYDWPEWQETPAIKKKYIEVTKKRISRFLKYHKKDWKTFLCYFRYDSESYAALLAACKAHKIKIKNCLDEQTWNKIKGETNPLALKEAITCLKACL